MNWKKRILSCIILLFLLAAVCVIGYREKGGFPVFGKTLEESGEKKIALTFDDGPHPYLYGAVVGRFEKTWVKAHVFL